MYIPVVSQNLGSTAHVQSTRKRNPFSNVSALRHNTTICLRRSVQFPKPQRRRLCTHAAKDPSDQHSTNNGSQLEDRPAPVEVGAEVGTNSGGQTAKTEPETAQASSSASAAKSEPSNVSELEYVLPRRGEKSSKDVNFFQGILEETQLIEWPSPLQALGDTVLVIAIVTFTAVVLFGVNTVLADISKAIY